MSGAPDLGCAVFDDVTLLPCRPDRGSRTGYSFGAVDRNGIAISAFDHPWCIHRRPDAAAPRVAGRFIYGGMLMDHFGHFLLEAMARLWFIRAHPELPVLWHEIALPVPHSAWGGWLDHVWRLLGLDRHRHHVIRAPIRCEMTMVPRPGFTSSGLHPLQAAALAVVREADRGAADRVWLSRDALPGQFGRLLGETALEARLAERGWKIVHPEAAGATAIARLFAGAATVAGFAGSAFHAVLLAEAPRARLRLLRRPSVATLHYDLVAAARGLDLAHIEIGLRAIGPLNAWTTFQILDIDAAAEAVLAAAA